MAAIVSRPECVNDITSYTSTTYGNFCLPLELCADMSVACQMVKIPTGHKSILCIAT